jgi:thioredoxin-dependent peroxiredoxin
LSSRFHKPTIRLLQAPTLNRTSTDAARLDYHARRDTSAWDSRSRPQPLGIMPESSVIGGFLLLALAIAVLLLWHANASVRRKLPKAGDTAPPFTLPDQNGTVRTLADFRGKWLVLYFYPRDDTPGCTEQAGRYRDAMRNLEALGAAVCGVSVDSSDSHADFSRKYKLPFTLLADRKGTTAAQYGSLRNFGILKFAKRNTFLVDPQGKIAKVYVRVNAARNAQDVGLDLKALTS